MQQREPRSGKEVTLLLNFVSLLVCCLLFFLLSFISVLLAAKRTKSPGTRKVQSAFSLLRSCLFATSLGQKGIASKFFLLVFGWCGTPSVSYRLQRHLTNSQTVLPLFPKTKRTLLVSFNGAGVVLGLPMLIYSRQKVIRR